jgi:hypothetical protein
VLEKRMLMEEGTGGWRKCYNDDVHEDSDL